MGNQEENNDMPLSSYRVLDLTEGGINWCGKVLGDLGADVIKVEPPGGSPTRQRAPFFGEDEDPNKSLFWFAYCNNKRSVTLNLETEEGRGLFTKLITSADFLLESFPPGYLDSLGLSYAKLSSLNPGLIMTSVTPYGQTGPYASYKATDMVSWAMGGNQFITGDSDRPPVRISFPQAELHAAAQAAAGSMVAFWHRQMTGVGQHVDVSIQISVVWTLINASTFPPLRGLNVERAGVYRDMGGMSRKNVFECKDGYVSALVSGGPIARRSMDPLSLWMEEEGLLPEFMSGRDWASWDIKSIALDESGDGIKELKKIEEIVGGFFATKTKEELYDRALSHGIFLAPCQDVRDVNSDPQLESRNFWVNLYHPELNSALRYPGPFIKLSESPLKLRRPAPTIGEHNQDILVKELNSEADSSNSIESSDNTEMSMEIRKPFQGVRILDFSWVVVGPTTVKYFADNGAEVIRVESTSRTDVIRSSQPYKGDEPTLNNSQYSGNHNTNKLGLGINMSKPESLELIKRIIREWQPDIIAESFTPRVMSGWGLGYDEVRKIKSDIIYFSTCQQGQTGPRSHYAGFGFFAAALSGFYHMTGWEDRAPAGPHGPYTDVINPANAATALVGALEYRRRTGKGQFLDLSQYECATQFFAPALLDYTVNGRIFNRRGNRDDRYAPHGVYKCLPEKRIYTGEGSSWCVIAVTTDDEWNALCEVMGRENIRDDPRFIDFEQRLSRTKELDFIIEEWTKTLTAHQAMKILQDAGIPSGAVQSQSDLWQDEQLSHYNYFQWLEHTEAGPMPYDGPRFTLSKTPEGPNSAQSVIGEHNEFILKDMLGFSDDEIAELIIGEVLENSFIT